MPISKTMKFTIRTLIVSTLLIALSSHAFLQWRRIVRIKLDLSTVQAELNRLNFDAESVDSHTKVCELAIANNPLPSPYFLAAKQRHQEVATPSQGNAK